MTLRNRLHIPALSAILIAAPAIAAVPQQAAPDFSRFGSAHIGRTIPQVIDGEHRLQLVGNIPVAARRAELLGVVDPKLPMERMILSLKMSPDAQLRRDQLLEAQQDPISPYFHKWLTAQQFGDLFGPSKEDVDAVASWLMSQGFSIDEVSPSRMTINFSGNVAKVQSAFRTSIQKISVDGETRQANVTEPSIPMALSDVVAGIVSLHNIPREAMNHGFRKATDQEVAEKLGQRASGIQPNYTSGNTHFMVPSDFATIYDVNPLYSGGFDGTGETVAIVGRTDIGASDVSTFRSTFGLAAKSPTIVHNGTDPGVVSTTEEGEADLDVQWSGAVARNATIQFVVSKSTSTTDGVDLSAQYIADNGGPGGSLAASGVASMSTSFGQCEAHMGSTELAFYNNVWSQAASEGITAFVSAGDAGASGCDTGGTATGSGLAVSGLASTPYNVCVGGTEFNDPTASETTWWNTSNAAGTYLSAKSYIPEMAWNESGGTTDPSGTAGADLWSTGGGVSGVYAKPSWQSALGTGVGMPADGKRDCPDVSLSAASHDGYFIVIAGSYYTSGGTSASSPSFAGLMALVAQKVGSAQGNANSRFYRMANAQYQAGSLSTPAFHDITSGNNTVPGVTGYSTGTGYDLVTGLGSVDANNLANMWADVTGPIATPSVTGTSGTVTLNCAASDAGSGVSRVGFWVDNNSVGTVHASPYQVSFDSTALNDGTHTLKVTAFDQAGNYTTTSASFSIQNDFTAPTASCSVTGTSGTIQLNATASDNKGVNRVGFFVDSVGVATLYSSPYQVSFDSTTLSNGHHTLKVVAHDASGNTGIATYSFTVSN